MSYQQRAVFDHLKLHDKYLFDAKARQIVAAVAAPKMGRFVGDCLLLLIIHCLNQNFSSLGREEFFRKAIGILRLSGLIPHRSRDSVS